MYDGVLVNKKEWGFQNEAAHACKTCHKSNASKKTSGFSKNSPNVELGVQTVTVAILFKP